MSRGSPIPADSQRSTFMYFMLAMFLNSICVQWGIEQFGDSLALLVCGPLWNWGQILTSHRCTQSSNWVRFQSVVCLLCRYLKINLYWLESDNSGERQAVIGWDMQRDVIQWWWYDTAYLVTCINQWVVLPARSSRCVIPGGNNSCLVPHTD